MDDRYDNYGNSAVSKGNDLNKDARGEAVNRKVAGSASVGKEDCFPKFSSREEDAKNAMEFIPEVVREFARASALYGVQATTFTVCATVGTGSMGNSFFPTIQLGLRRNGPDVNLELFPQAVMCLRESITRVLFANAPARYATLAVTWITQPIE